MSKTSKTNCCGTGPKSCCAGPADHNRPWIAGFTDTPVGRIPLVKTQLDSRDQRGTLLARWTGKRMSYSIPPGLYGVGNPTAESHVLVTANYKLTFDKFRKELTGLDAWILVLDTKGINVWCAAGKGTFGTAELIHRIKTVELDKVVSKKKIILPQLGAPGVAAHTVTKETGFKVVYGPVLASDIPVYLREGLKKTPAMRKVRFPFMERLVLAPLELVQALKFCHYILIPLLLLGLLQWAMFPFNFLMDLALFTGILLIGTVIAPAMLPWLPGRAFSFKGWLPAALFVAAMTGFVFTAGTVTLVASLLLFPPIAAFIALNFTGASTYTSLSGVVKEMRFAIPMVIISAAAGLILKIYSLF